MLALAGRLGAARLATGHYARVVRDAGGPLLRAGADPAKDQAYMLARLAPEQLERLWFPLGELTKPEVRERARAASLPVAEKPESQDLCFLAGVGRERFLRRHGGERLAAQPGEVVSLDGRVLARHDGQHAFTVGQRRGLGVAGGEPLYVVDKDPASGRVVVGPRAALATRAVAVRAARLWRDGAEVDRVKLRYRSEPVPCAVAGDPPAGAHRELALELAADVEGVAAGQLACLMAGDRVAGWGTIGGPLAARSATMPAREVATRDG
jgi:tRNA-uridine 2-sulfurtransferase